MGKRIPEEVLTAFHEAGHVVAARDLSLSFPKWVSIAGDAERLGACQSDEGFWQSPDMLRLKLSADLGGLMSPAEWRARCREGTESNVVADLAGYAAEWRRVRFSRFAGAYTLSRMMDAPGEANDLRRALDQLEVFETAPKAREDWLYSLWDRSWRLVGKSWRDVDRLAAVLIEKRRLEIDELASMLLPTEEE
jgi:hypothetical protein